MTFLERQSLPSHICYTIQEYFTTTRDGWQAIRALALRWCFTRIMVRSLYELRHFDRRHFSLHQRQWLSINAPYLVNSLQLRRWEDRYVRPALAEDDEEN